MADNTNPAVISQEEYDELMETVTELKNAYSQAVAENTAMKREFLKLAASQAGDKKVKVKPVIPTETFEVGGNRYRFTIPRFLWNKEEVTATDALNDPKILQALVARKVSFVKPVEE